MWSREQARALKVVFNALDQNSIPWLVLRNYEGLPEVNRSKDIDLGIGDKDIGKAAYIIANALKALGFDKVFTTNFACMRCSTYFKVTNDNVVSIKIDLMDGFVWRGAHVFDATKLHAESVQYNGFFVPNPVDDGVMLLIKPLMTGAGVKEKYADDIRYASASDPLQYKKRLDQILGRKMASKLWLSIQQNRLNDIAATRRRLSWSAWLRSARQSPIKVLNASLQHVLLEVVRRSTRMPASFLAVVGPDGVGKTTFINLFQEELSRILVKNKDNVRVNHFRPHLLPNIKQIFSGKQYDSSKEEFSKPHRATPASTPSSLLRLVYYWVDYIIGYWLLNRRECANGAVLIFDRYFYDFVVDPRRSRINLPVWIRNFFLNLTPQPDIVIFLDCDPETVYARKQELERDEIERQLKEYRKLASKFPNRFIRLNAQQLPEASCLQALREIVRRSFTQI